MERYVSNSDIVELLARRMKEYRLTCRMSQKDLADKSGVGLATIAHFEQGVSQNLTLKNFIALLRAMGMERNIEEMLPELPMPPMAIKEIRKYIPKRIKSKKP